MNFNIIRIPEQLDQLQILELFSMIMLLSEIQIFKEVSQI